VTDTLEHTAKRIADRGRDALLARLRPAFADAARAHADRLQLDSKELERMVQRAADRADGLQWRRALASVAADELGIGLGEALGHPAVERAQAIVGAPSYEDSLAALEARHDPLVAEDRRQRATRSDPATSPATGQPEPASAPPPSAAARRDPTPTPPPAPVAQRDPAPTPPPAPVAQRDPTPTPPPAPVAQRDPTPAQAPAPVAQRDPTAAHAPVPATEPRPGPVSAAAQAGSRHAPSDVRAQPKPDARTVAKPPPQADAATGATSQPQADTPTVATPQPQADTPTVATSQPKSDATARAATSRPAPPSSAEDGPRRVSIPRRSAEPEPVRVTAIHLGGVTNLRPGESEIELRLSEHGLDIARHSGEIIGRLGWDEIQGLEVPPPRGLQRLRRAPRAHLVVRAGQGDASFEIPSVYPEELREHLDPILAQHGWRATSR
jgi:hypothetical protein